MCQSQNSVIITCWQFCMCPEATNNTNFVITTIKLKSHLILSISSLLGFSLSMVLNWHTCWDKTESICNLREQAASGPVTCKMQKMTTYYRDIGLVCRISLIKLGQSRHRFHLRGYFSIEKWSRVNCFIVTLFYQIYSLYFIRLEQFLTM